MTPSNLSNVKPVRILTDEIEIEPKFDFDRYSQTIVNIVMGSTPQFSIGIYGEWGTGKSTLMKMVEKRLKEIDNKSGKILPIWFNAWRYEREEQFAMIALMKTLAYGMADHQNYQNVSKTILNGLKIIGKDVLRSLAVQTILSEKGLADFEKNLTPKMEFVNKLDKDTIYFDGIQKIQEEMTKIISDNVSRVIVFIDDLDRCSPKKALEVFESIKIFLDIKGIIYIIGLSHETIAKLITTEYHESGIKGEHYIRKIIQTPIRLPQWNKKDVERLIEEQIVKKLDEPYSKIISQNKNLISLFVEPNPRELKRFVNNIIIALEIFSDIGNIEYDELILVEALKSRWSNFYMSYSSDNDFRLMIASLENQNNERRLACIHSWRDSTNLTEDEKIALRDTPSHIKNASQYHKQIVSELDEELWGFLKNPIIQKLLKKIKNWESYRRITAAVEEISVEEAITATINPDVADVIQAYCVNCRKKVIMNGPIKTKLKNGRPAIKGKCSICGNGVFVIRNT